MLPCYQFSCIVILLLFFSYHKLYSHMLSELVLLHLRGGWGPPPLLQTEYGCAMVGCKARGGSLAGGWGVAGR